MKVRMIVCALTAGAAIALAGDASAAVWRWGCAGSIGDGQIVSNRGQLLVLPAKAPHAALDQLIFLDDLTKDAKLSRDFRADIADYAADDGNGLEQQMTYSRNSQSGGKLVLTEMSSTTLSHSIVSDCRDEIIDRFRKVYRLTVDDRPPRDVTLECIEYMLTTRGGRTCD